MGSTSILTVKILGDGSNGAKAFDQAAASAAKFDQVLSRVAVASAAAAAAVAAIGYKAIKAASDQQQAFGALEAVYKGNAGAMKEWAKQQAQIGISTAAAAQAAAYFGSMLKGAGIPLEATADQTKRLTGLAADLAATYGGDVSEAITALAATMRGEYDPIERFGVSLRASDISARLAAKGMAGLTGEALKQAEMQERLNLIFEKTRDAQGQAAREAQTWEGRTQRLRATVENAFAAFGTTVLPIAERMAGALEIGANMAERHATATGLAITAFGLLAGALAASIAGLKIYNTLTELAAIHTRTMALRAGEATVAQAAYALVIRKTGDAMALAALSANAGLVRLGASLGALAANPVGLAILAIVAAIALIAGVIKLAYDHIASFRKLWDETWAKAAALIKQVMAIIGPAVLDVMNAIREVFDKVAAAIKPYIDKYWPEFQAAVMDAARAAQDFWNEYGDVLLPLLTGPLAMALGLIAVLVLAMANNVRIAISLAASQIRFLGAVIGFVIDITKAWISTVETVAGAISDAFDKAWQKISDFWEKIKNIAANIRSIVPFVNAAPAPMSIVMLGAGSGGTQTPFTFSGGGQTESPVIVNRYEITINGQLIDPEGAARAIEQVMNRHGARAGAQPFARVIA